MQFFTSGRKRHTPSEDPSRFVTPQSSARAAIAQRAMQAAWSQDVAAWTEAVAAHVDLHDLQTQPIWQQQSAPGLMPAAAKAQLSHLDLPRMRAWFERPMPHRVGHMARGERPKEAFVARLRASRVPERHKDPKGMRRLALPLLRQPSRVNAAETLAIAGLAHGDAALCIDILVPPKALSTPAWGALLGAPHIGILPPAAVMRELVWTLSLRSAAAEPRCGQSAYLPALAELFAVRL